MKQLGIIPQSTELSPRSPYYDWGTDVGVRNPEWDLLSDERKRDLARRMAIYAAMVDRLDQSIGRVIAELEYRNELRNTLVVFTSDNGACAEWDPFGFDIRSGPQNILHRGQEISHMGSAGTFHSVGSGWAGASNTPWRLYKHFNHEGGIAVPCIIHWPGRLRDDGGRIVDTPAHLIDLVPTMLDAAGSRAGSNVVDELPGSSLLPLLDGEALPARMLFFEHEGNRAVRAGRWKLVALRRQDWELYDMSVDRSEMRNRASERPELVRQLSDAWDGWAKRNHVTPLPDDYGVEYITSGPSGQSCSSE